MKFLPMRTPGTARRPSSTAELLPSERRFVAAMTELGWGSFEHIRLRAGELVLDPWPTTVRSVKFGFETAAIWVTLEDDFELKRQVADFFECVRSLDNAQIRSLTIRHGLPFAMEVVQMSGSSGGDDAA